jgi:hypothetical protein
VASVRVVLGFEQDGMGGWNSEAIRAGTLPAGAKAESGKGLPLVLPKVALLLAGSQFAQIPGLFEENGASAAANANRPDEAQAVSDGVGGDGPAKAIAEAGNEIGEGANPLDWFGVGSVLGHGIYLVGPAIRRMR